jgi:hypothetical protein
MKKLLVAAAMLVALSGSASAQGGGGGGMQMSPEQMAQMMAQRIDAIYKGVTISDDVKKQATEIYTKAQADSRAVDRNAADAADQRKKITDKRNADLVALVKSDADKKTVTDNIAALPTGRGGRPPV